METVRWEQVLWVDGDRYAGVAVYCTFFVYRIPIFTGKVRPIQFQPAADWQIQEECVEAKEERQHHIESKNEEKK